MRDDGAIVFSGGGSGGHLFPGIAVANALSRLEGRLRIAFCGSRRRIEQKILRDQNFECFSIDAAPSTMLKKNPVGFLWRYWRARSEAKRLLAECNARVVVGLGGYASVPVVLAANSMKIPTLLLEQNVVVGRANRWLSGSADLMCHAFADAITSTPRARETLVTGNPVRREIAELTESPQDCLHGGSEDSTSGKRNLLILGGSQGARSLNAAVVESIRTLVDFPESWNITHQTGASDEQTVRAAYGQMGIDCLVSPFFTDMSRLYGRADLVISRGGATTFAELACAGLPAIVMPIPNALRDHQRLNAEQFSRAGAVQIVTQESDSHRTAEALSSCLRRLLGNTTIRGRMANAMRTLARPDAATIIAAEVLRFANLPERSESRQRARRTVSREIPTVTS